MITDADVALAGNTLKPHGINGELVAAFDDGISPESLSCLIFKVDGIYVPFFVKSWRPKGHEYTLLSIDGLNNETEAESLASQDFYALRNELPETAAGDDDGLYVSDLIGWTVEDDSTPVGKITDYDDSTSNLLLMLERADGSTLIVPLAEDLIEEVDNDRKVLVMNLPKGL